MKNSIVHIDSRNRNRVSSNILNDNFVLLSDNPLSTFKNKKTIRIEIDNHTFTNNDRITLQNVKSFNILTEFTIQIINNFLLIDAINAEGREIINNLALEWRPQAKIQIKDLQINASKFVVFNYIPINLINGVHYYSIVDDTRNVFIKFEDVFTDYPSTIKTMEMRLKYYIIRARLHTNQNIDTNVISIDFTNQHIIIEIDEEQQEIPFSFLHGLITYQTHNTYEIDNITTFVTSYNNKIYISHQNQLLTEFFNLVDIKRTYDLSTSLKNIINNKNYVNSINTLINNQEIYKTFTSERIALQLFEYELLEVLVLENSINSANITWDTNIHATIIHKNGQYIIPVDGYYFFNKIHLFTSFNIDSTLVNVKHIHIQIINNIIYVEQQNNELAVLNGNIVDLPLDQTDAVYYINIKYDEMADTIFINKNDQTISFSLWTDINVRRLYVRNKTIKHIQFAQVESDGSYSDYYSVSDLKYYNNGIPITFLYDIELVNNEYRLYTDKDTFFSIENKIYNNILIDDNYVNIIENEQVIVRFKNVFLYNNFSFKQTKGTFIFELYNNSLTIKSYNNDTSIIENLKQNLDNNELIDIQLNVADLDVFVGISTTYLLDKFFNLNIQNNALSDKKLQINLQYNTNNTVQTSAVLRLISLTLNGFQLEAINTTDETYHNITSLSDNFIEIELDIENLPIRDNTASGGKDILLSKIKEQIIGYPNTNHFEINLDRIFHNVVQIELVSSEIPMFMHNITDYNNTLSWYEVHSGSHIYSMEIIPGCYSKKQILYKIRDALSTLQYLPDPTKNFHIIVSTTNQSYFKCNTYIKFVSKQPLKWILSNNSSNNIELFIIFELYIQNHFLYDNDEIILENCLSYYNVPEDKLNTTHKIQIIDNNRVQITITNYNPTTTTFNTNGGNEVIIYLPTKIKLVSNNQYNLMTLLGIVPTHTFEHIITNSIPFSTFIHPYCYLYMTTNMYFNNKSGSTNNRIILSKIQFEGDYEKYIYNTFIAKPVQFLEPIKELHNITFSLQYSDDMFVNFSNAELSFSLNITEQYESL